MENACHKLSRWALKIRRSWRHSTAAIYCQLKGGSGGANAMAMSKALHNDYSRDDEREADAFGVACRVIAVAACSAKSRTRL